MSIRFACPECKQLLGASTRKAGRRVQCPKCNAEVTVPTEAEAAAAAVLRRFEHPEIEEAINTLFVVDRGAEGTSSADRAAAARPDANGAEAPGHAVLLIPRKVVYFQAGLLAVVAITFFLAGWWIGGSGQTPVLDLPATGGPATLNVLLHYRSSNGELRADEGAVVLVLPTDNRVTEKLQAAALDPTAPQPNAASPVIGKLNLIGGAYGRTDAAGKLAGLIVPRPAKHYLLLLSNHARRSGEPRPQDLAALGTYLEGAAELLGNRAYRLTSEDLKGEVAITHDFGVE
jgi:hypothetical protein